MYSNILIICVFKFLFFYCIVLGKIEELSQRAGDSFNQLSQIQLESLVKLCDVNNSPDEQSVNLLVTLLNWPKGKY